MAATSRTQTHWYAKLVKRPGLVHSAAGIGSPLRGIAKTTDTRTGTEFHASTACFARLRLRSYLQLPEPHNSEIEMQGDGHTSDSRYCSVLRFR